MRLTSFNQIRCALRRGISRGLIVLALASYVVGCAASIGADMLPSEQVFSAINLNYKAVNLALVAPYDTATLLVAPTSLRGTPLAYDSQPEFISQSDRVIVFPNGMLRAQGQTSASGINVLVRMTIDGVTRIDTVRVTVTSVASPPRLAVFEIQPRDSVVTVPQFNFYDGTTLRLSVRAIDSSGAPISRVVVRFDVSSPDLLVGDGGTYQGLRTGNAVIYAQAHVYGITVRDSIRVRIAERLVELVILQPDGTLNRTNATIFKGGGVYWINQTNDSIDIVFDDPSVAQRACCSQLGMLVGDASGNIDPFIRDLTKPLTTLIGGFLTMPRAEPDIARGRTFSAPGVYKYRSLRRPNIAGTITVVD